MAKDLKATVKKRLKEGWIRSWMAIEVLAISKETAESSLIKHVEKMEAENQNQNMMAKKEYKQPQKVPHPFKKGEDAFSMVVELEMISRNFEDLLLFVIKFAPSSIEIEEPTVVKMSVGEAQGILNTIATLIHNFANASRGAITIDAK